MDADRTSLFLVDSKTNELYARIFDIGTGLDTKLQKEIRQVKFHRENHDMMLCMRAKKCKERYAAYEIRSLRISCLGFCSYRGVPVLRRGVTLFTKIIILKGENLIYFI